MLAGFAGSKPMLASFAGSARADGSRAGSGAGSRSPFAAFPQVTPGTRPAVRHVSPDRPFTAAITGHDEAAVRKNSPRGAERRAAPGVAWRRAPGYYLLAMSSVMVSSLASASPMSWPKTSERPVEQPGQCTG